MTKSQEIKPTKVKASDHESYNTLSVISLLFPLVGYIMGAIYLSKDQKVDRKLGEHLLVMAVFGSVLVFILWALVLSVEPVNTPYVDPYHSL